VHGRGEKWRVGCMGEVRSSYRIASENGRYNREGISYYIEFGFRNFMFPLLHAVRNIFQIRPQNETLFQEFALNSKI
jgi:hypothetical protein